VDWKVKDDKYYIDYGQIESRDHDNTKTNWWVALPGYSYIRRSDVVNTQAYHSNSQSYESKPVFMTEYKPIQYKKEYKPVNNVGNTPTQNKEAQNKSVYGSEFKPSVQYKEESTKSIYKTEYKPIKYKEENKPVSNAGYNPTQYGEAYSKPISETEYKPVQYKEESIKPVQKTEYKPIAQNKEYKPIYDAARYTNEED